MKIQMSLRQRVMEELKVQEKVNGHVENRDLIVRILNTCKTESEFFTFCNVTHHKYGVLSYQSHRFYSVKAHLLPLIVA